MDEPTARFVSVAKVGDPSVAHLAVALLRSAGIAARAHGEALGPYRLTVGEMAVTEIWVPEPDLDDAREVLEGSEVDATPDLAVHTGALADPSTLPMRLVAGLTLAGLAWAVLRYVMRVF